MQVKIGTIPGIVKDYAVGESATVQDCMNAAGIEDGFTMTVDGVPCHPTTVVRAGQRIVGTKNAKGN